MLVSVIIVTWNGRHFLEECLPALYQSLEHIGSQSEVIVVDNGSSDGTIEYLEHYDPSPKVIRNPCNFGFSKANNQGFREASGKYMVTLNNDTVVHPLWLVKALEHLESDHSWGMVATQMRFLNDQHLINSAGISVDRIGIAQDRFDGKPLAASEISPKEVFGPSAGAAIYRRELIEELKGFDESFGSYFEDVDLAWRARRAGWRCVYVPESIVLHAYSATSRRVPNMKSFLLSRNRVWLIVKNASRKQLVTQAPLLLVSELGAMVAAAVLDRSFSPIKGRWSGLMGLPRVLRQRGELPYLPLDAFDPPSPLGLRLRNRLARNRMMSNK